eukprot:TRINITY_DN15202_c0_g1_i1.p1 TRINITY_DN15202_c0_g1~~TRINITY_DN15202_c0_g1_i1.p1  ORF type:complete len:168 (+),score=25.69 TRINITY_DN15202_c0_g1_i1:833-1336(+)
MDYSNLNSSWDSLEKVAWSKSLKLYRGIYGVSIVKKIKLSNLMEETGKALIENGNNFAVFCEIIKNASDFGDVPSSCSAYHNGLTEILNKIEYSCRSLCRFISKRSRGSARLPFTRLIKRICATETGDVAYLLWDPPAYGSLKHVEKKVASKKLLNEKLVMFAIDAA